MLKTYFLKKDGEKEQTYPVDEEREHAEDKTTQNGHKKKPKGNIEDEMTNMMNLHLNQTECLRMERGSH